MSPTKRTAQRAEIRQTQRRWVNHLLEQTKQSASELARNAGLADVTLTRFLNNPEYDGVLSHVTLRALADYAGVAPPAGAGSEQINVPMPDAEPFDIDAALGKHPTLAAVVHTVLSDRTEATAWVLRSNVLSAAHYAPGDILIVDEAVKPTPHEAVLAELHDRSGTELVFRIYEPPVLTTAPQNVKDRHAPLVVDGVRVVVRGTVVGAIRSPNRR